MTTELPQQLQKALDDHRREFYTSMLTEWLYDAEDKREIPSDIDALSAMFSEVYNLKCENVHPYRDLESEDYESVDWNEGWENGFFAAVDALNDVSSHV